MKNLLACFFIFLFNHSFAQLSSVSFKELHAKENQMKEDAFKMLYDTIPEGRIKSDSAFTKKFVQALKITNSFYYPFDSLITVSRLYAPDSAFRIFTWQQVISNYVIRQHGAIQIRTADGSLKLFPLIDKSDAVENMSDTSADNTTWIGAVYYRIILNKRNDQNVYTLLGYDENNVGSTKKVIEVLEFKNDRPWFGGKNFQTPDNQLKATTHARYIMEFKKDANPRLNYDPELDMIVMEHLVSETNEPEKKSTFVGDGDYEGFKWIDGRWTYVSKIFTEITPEGKEPVPVPLRDAEGNVDETKLAGYQPDEESTEPKKETKIKKPAKKPAKKN